MKKFQIDTKFVSDMVMGTIMIPFIMFAVFSIAFLLFLFFPYWWYMHRIKK